MVTRESGGYRRKCRETKEKGNGVPDSTSFESVRGVVPRVITRFS